MRKSSHSQLRNICEFFSLFFEQSTIHGFVYLVKTFLTIIEKLFWLALIVSSLFFCIQIGMQSLDRFNTKSTVVSIEKDHYYWNTSLPSLTICPMDRLDRAKFDEYCTSRNIVGEEREEFFQFLESLANSSFLNFENIKEFESVEKLKLNPQEYMLLIFNLTTDLTHAALEDKRVRTLSNLEYIQAQQVLTEYGICYLTNNFLIDELSASASFLITGKRNEQNTHQTENNAAVIHEVRFGNLFDGDITYSFIGFPTAISMFLHSPYETINIGKNLGYAVDAFEFEVFSIEIIVSDDFEKSTTISQRGCRFSYESNLTHFRHYTKSICLEECRLNIAYEICGCIPHFYPNRIKNPKKVCDYKTLKTCFPDKKDMFLQLHEPGSKKPVNCFCLQNCQESKVVIERMKVMGDSKDLLGSIGGLVIVKRYPLIRYKRQILFTFTDLLVSIGGTAGFFLGFSVLGVVEIIYFFTLRFLWYQRGRT